MLARPIGRSPVGDSCWVSYRERLSSLNPEDGEKSFRENVWSHVVQAATDLLTEAGCSFRPRDVEDWLRSWTRYEMDRTSARRVLLQSLGFAIGRCNIDVPFALGEAWQNLSPQLQAVVNPGAPDVAHLKTHKFFQREMERIAFGRSTFVKKSFKPVA